MPIRVRVRLRLAAAILCVGLSGACATWSPAPPRNAWLDRTNDVRAYNGVPRIMWETELERMAQDWADTLCSTSAFQHRDLAAVLDGPYLRWNWLGENIATTPPGMSYEQVLAAWVRSPAHFENLIASRPDAVGIAMRSCGARDVWVMDLGDYR